MEILVSVTTETLIIITLLHTTRLQRLLEALDFSFKRKIQILLGFVNISGAISFGRVELPAPRIVMTFPGPMRSLPTIMKHFMN